jgi:hypothetical protein
MARIYLNRKIYIKLELKVPKYRPEKNMDLPQKRETYLA